MKIVVLAGGISTERDVSLSSGTMIYNALHRLGHQVIMLDVYLGYPEEEIGQIFELNKEWAKDMGAIGAKNPDIEAIKAKRSGDSKAFFGPHVIDICQQAELVFLALHGENGENGKIQAAFDLLGIRYTGNDPVGCALAMDKALAKELFRFHEIPTPSGMTLRQGEEIPEQIEYPCVVKTTCGGSSVGVYIVHNQTEYHTALHDAFTYENEVIVEQYIKGREFGVGVVGGKALPVIEIAPVTGFYDYKNKYQAGSAIETCPAELPTDIALSMQKCAEQVFKVLRLDSYARMDFLMEDNGAFYCLEANTLPGMTPTSLLPQEAKEAGYSYDALCAWIIRMAMEK
ncbi:MAG: D-alanine--D-alanine ligase [Lachnospiraceae bacterium]